MVEKISNSKIEFDDETKKEIAAYALEIARLGEDALQDLRREKMKLVGVGFNIIGSDLPPEEKLAKSEEIKVATDTIGEVIRQAVSIRQTLGLDRYTNDMIRFGLLKETA